jgi:hypothetical protein
VSRVEPSRFEEGTAYVSIDGHRSDEFDPWIFATTDYGQTWDLISQGIPAGNPIYVIREDPRNPDLLYAGSEFGAYVSVDRGRSWEALGQGLPTVAVHDLVIHPRDGDVIAATHGRSIWILDDVTPLQQLNSAVQESQVHLFVPKAATLWKGISRGATRGHKLFMGRNPLTIAQQPPGNSPVELQNSAAISFWLGAGVGQAVTVEISSLDGRQVVTREVEGHPGLNRWFWDLRWDPSPEDLAAFEERMAEARERFGGQVPAFFQGRGPTGSAAGAGTYEVLVRVGGSEAKGTLVVREDPGLQGVLPSVR